MKGLPFGGTAVTVLTCETAMNTGRAAAAVLSEKTGRRVRIIIGTDTRASADILGMALSAGVLSAGADAVKLRTAPVPAAIFAAKELAADCIIMLSPEHGSFEYNEIRIFSPEGGSLPRDIYERIAELAAKPAAELARYLKSGAGAGRLIDFTGWQDGYISRLLSAGESSLSGLRIAADCANGSASVTAERLFSGLGAKVYLLCCDPDGTNIERDCGVSCMDTLIKFVRDKKCDVGIAFDGSGEKCIAVDEEGAVVDGDKLTAIFAGDMNSRSALADHTAVVSAVTNLGFSFFAKEKGIKTVTAKAGEGYILEQMKAGGYSLGGEQSGRIIFGDFLPVSDGQLTAIKLLSVMKRSGKKLSELASVMKRYPRVMINVKILPDKREVWKNLREIESIIEKREKELGDSGRILVRESASEPVIRVMVECESFPRANEIALEIADTVKEHCSR